jgi:AcrR family transcriptional regulator
MSPTRVQNRDDQRRRILDAAHGLFAETGFDDVTVADVARRAGVARATVFNHFQNKHGLVEALANDVMDVYLAMLDAALADTETPTPALVLALFEQMAIGIEAEPRFYRGVFRQFAALQVGLDERDDDDGVSAAATDRVVHLLERGQRRGEITDQMPAEEIAAAMSSLLSGTITRWLYSDRPRALASPMANAALLLLEPVAIGAVARDAPRPNLGPDPELRGGTP